MIDMVASPSAFDSLGRKVQRAQYELDRIQGDGESGGIRVTVDADGRLVSVTGPDAPSILAAYRRALADLAPKVERITRDIAGDPLVSSVSQFVEANKSGREAARRNAEDYEERLWAATRDDPLGRRR